MARYRKDEEKKPTRNLVSDKALNALTSGTYDQLTGRDPKYRSSNDQIKSTAGLPVLKGVLGSNNDTWESSFSRRNNTPLEIDTGRARRKYEERIGHNASDFRDLKNRGYESSYTNIDFDKLIKQENANMGSGLMLLDNALAEREAARRRSKIGSEAFNKWYESITKTPEAEAWDRQWYINNFGRPKEEVLDAYEIYLEGKERKEREESPFKAGWKDFKSAPDRAIASAVGNLAHKYFTDSDLDKMANSDFVQKEVKKVNKQRDYTYNSYKLSDTKKALAKLYNEGGDTATNVLASALLGTPFAVGEAAEGFGLVAELNPLISKGFNLLSGYGEAAGSTKHELERAGYDDKKATDYANAIGLLGAGSRLAEGLKGAQAVGGTMLERAINSGKFGAKLGLAKGTIKEIADALVLEDQGSIQSDINKYVSQGMSNNEATVRAVANSFGRVIESGGIDALVGAGFSLLSGGAEKVASKAKDDLNSVWATQNALPQNDIPLLTGTADNTQALSGTTYNHVPALVDNIYPIQMSGTNGVIPMTGTQGTITLPDLASKSASVGKTIQRAVAERVYRPRTTTPIAGAEKEQAEIRLKFIDKSIKTNKQQIEQYNKLAKTGKNKAERKLYSDKAKALEVQNQELKTEKTDLNRQMKGELTPIKELLPDNVMKEVSSLKNEIKKVSNMYVGAENKALAKDAITALDNYIETGDMRYYNDFYNNVTALEKAATETYVNKTDPTKTSTYGTYHSADDGTSLGELVSLVQKNGQPGMYAKNLIPAVRNLVKEQNAKAVPTVVPTVPTTAPVPQRDWTDLLPETPFYETDTYKALRNNEIENDQKITNLMKTRDELNKLLDKERIGYKSENELTDTDNVVNMFWADSNTPKYSENGEKIRQKIYSLDKAIDELKARGKEITAGKDKIKADTRNTQFANYKFDLPAKATKNDYPGFDITWGTNGDVQEALDNGTAFISEMSPLEYLQRSTYDLEDRATLESVMETANGINSVHDYADAMRRGEKFPIPSLTYGERTERGQEGRTRALAAYEAGIDTIPVAIIGEPKANTPIPEYKPTPWSAEEEEAINKAIADEMDELYGVKSENALLNDNDVNDYLVAGKNGFHKNRYDAYMNGTQIVANNPEELKGAIQSIINTPKDKLGDLPSMQPIGVMRVSKNIADQINAKDSEVDASNYFFQLEPNDVWHSFKDHQLPKEENDLPMDIDDMVYAITHLNDGRVIDVIKESGGRKLAKLIIPETNGNEYYTAQVISKGDGALSLKTLMKIKKGSMDAIEDSKSPNAIRSHTTSPSTVPSEKENVNTPNKGYWLRVLGDDNFAVAEAEKQGVSVDILKKAASDNTGYDIPSTGGGSVPPSNDVPPTNEPSGNGPMRERGMSRHMGKEEKMTVDIPQEVKDDFINDPDMYEALSNKATSDKALRIYNEHPNDREAIFRNMLTQYDPAALPLGQMIAKDYSAAGNHAMAAQIFRDMGERLTKAGQFSQASILTMLKNDPLTAREYAERSIDKLNKQGKKEFGKKWNDMSLTKEELDAFKDIEPGDEKALAELYDKIGQRLGKEYPSTMMEKLLEGRKVAMLFNVRTISRNFFANPPTLGMRWMADRVEAVGQNIVHLIDPTFEKTQSLRSGGAGRKIAKQFTKTERYKNLVNGVDEKHMVPDLKSEIIHHKQMYKGTAAEKFIDRWSGNAFNSISDALYEAGKINNNPHIKGGIQALNKKLFKKDDVQSVLETIRNTTYKLLDVTDSPFVKENFVERLGSYLNAQGITNIKDIPDAAVDIAWNEAMKATYKDDSWMVKVLSNVKKGVEKIPGIGKPLSQGLIPFLQAPGNIAARMVDYSPINLTKGIAQIIKGAAKKDHETIRKGIEAAAKGLTGSGLALLGMKLYQSGVLTGDYSQDNKEKSFQQRNGFKPWSLHVAGKYFTFNWMQPFAQNIMAGILAQQAIDHADQFDSDVLRHFGIEGSTAGKVIGAAYESGKAAVNSWFDESPLGDLTKLFSGSYYDRDIAQNVVDVGEDFASAMYPAAGNATAKTIDTTKRNTKDPSNRFSTFLNEQIAKVPVASESLPAAYDTWGDEIKNANSRGEAFFQRFVYPGEYSSDSSDPLDVEIQRLFESTNDNRAFPFYAANKVGEKTLNNKEKSEYQKDMGQRSKQLAQAFVNSKQYKEMDDANRVETLNTLYYTSKAITERDLFDKPVADSSQYKKFIRAYDSAGGGKKGIEAVINMTQAKSSMKAANVSSSSNLGKKIEAAAKSGDDKAVQEMTSAAQSVEDLGFTKVGPKETYIKAKGIDPSLSVEDFGKTYKAIDTNGNQGITQKEVITYLNNNKVPELKGSQIFNMYAPAGKSTPAVKDDGTWYLQKPKKKK